MTTTLYSRGCPGRLPATPHDIECQLAPGHAGPHVSGALTWADGDPGPAFTIHVPAPSWRLAPAGPPSNRAARRRAR